jgi:hypothetical protein
MVQADFVDKIAQKIDQLGLVSVALLWLEAHRPLSFLGSQVLLVAQPTLNLFVSAQATTNMVELLADPVQLDQLLTQLQQKAQNTSKQSGNTESIVS